MSTTTTTTKATTADAVPTIEMTPAELKSIEEALTHVDDVRNEGKANLADVAATALESTVKACTEIKPVLTSLKRSHSNLKGCDTRRVFDAIKASELGKESDVIKASGRQLSNVIAVIDFHTKTKLTAFLKACEADGMTTPSDTAYAFELRAQATKDGKLTGKQATKNADKLTKTEGGRWTTPPKPSTPSAGEASATKVTKAIDKATAVENVQALLDTCPDSIDLSELSFKDIAAAAKLFTAITVAREAGAKRKQMMSAS